MFVPWSIVKFNDDQSKIRLISFMKKSVEDRGSWTKRQGEQCPA